ncbi:MAG: T9SS type A sorting domain-containing protein [Chitinophagaceae bacterium]|nr:T9SS type A sorting domain-containing protein [Chitinophagaceae bacterium]
MKIKLFLIVFTFCLSKQGATQDLLYLDGAGASPNLTIQTGAQVYVQGGFVANAGNTSIHVSGELHLIDGVTSTSSHFTDNTAAGCIQSTSTGTVFIESGLLQNVSAANTTFYNLYFNNSSINSNGIRMLTDVNVANQATFRDGLVYANTKVLRITSTAATAVTFSAPNTSSYIQSWLAAIYPSGKLDREMINNTSIYAFPVGNTVQAQLLEVKPTNITGISRFSASWEDPAIGTSSVALTECGTSYLSVNNGGEWHLRPANGGTYGSGSFSAGQMTISGYNLSVFSGLIDNLFGMLTRPEGSVTTATWTIPAPSCTSLAPLNAAGRTVASDYATRINLTAWSDNLSQIGIGVTSIPLPIELLSLVAWSAGNANELSWITESEINSSQFEVERSSDGKNFDSIGAESAAGISFKSLQYYFTDHHPAVGLNYYRVKMMDLDQSFRYSNVVSVERKGELMEAISIYPNPGEDDITLHIESDHDKYLMVHLTDELGRVLSSAEISVHTGTNFFPIQTAHLASAVYYVHIVDTRTNNSCVFKYLKVD